MENVNEKTFGIYFNEADIKGIVEKYLDWADMIDGQTFCAYDVMSENTPVGTSIIVGVDGIKCHAGSDVVKLIMSAGIYELDVKTATEHDDEIDIRLERTIPVPGTYGHIVDGELDILTDEEKEFKKVVEEALGDRDDEYAIAFRNYNIRKVGGRGMILLEKIKAEIKGDDLLIDNDITPTQLVSVFIEMTEKYINAKKNVDELNAKHDALMESYKETFEEGSKRTKKFARDIEVVNRKIESNINISDFCDAMISSAIMPVLDAEVEC